MHPQVNHVESVYHMKTQGRVDEDTYERWMAGIVSIMNTDGGKVWWTNVEMKVPWSTCVLCGHTSPQLPWSLVFLDGIAAINNDELTR
jgi:hypothetical protein